MLKSVLIANRGEIACRIIRTARKMGLRAIAVYSDADRNALHVRSADVAHYIGGSPASESYLLGDAILAAAKASGADCIHPGYGFLSENAGFAESCASAGIVFIGPSPQAIRAMGLKDGAKALMQKAGVPVVPGYHGARQDVKFLKEKAYETGYPVLIKAVAGGGGKGMRRVDAHANFEEALASAQREAQNAFGNPHVLIEKYIDAPRHIEMQVFGDSHGNAIHLFERDCSLQRRHQKVIEEAPAPGMTRDVREAMGRAAVNAAKAVDYAGAGTVEFIADGSRGLRPDGFFFMEMNTRLQVEHPVTEAITGLDLVEWQFRIAAGEALPLKQDDVKCEGHAVEARLYAEDPENSFLPSIGKLWALRFPVAGPGLRIETGVEQGASVTPFYDPMIAKIIAHSPTRGEALAKLAGALGETLVAGPRCNVAFLKALCEAPDFIAGQFDTGFIDRNPASLGAVPQPLDGASVAEGALHLIAREQARLAAVQTGESWSPWGVNDAFQFTAPRHTSLEVTANGEAVKLDVQWPASADSAPLLTLAGNVIAPPRGGESDLCVADASVLVIRRGRQSEICRRDLLDAEFETGDAGDSAVRSPMHGKLVALLVKAGDAVAKGQRLAVVEAMKMEHALTAPRAGIVSETHGVEGQQIAQGAAVVVIHADSSAPVN